MTTRIYPVLEHDLPGLEIGPTVGKSLARVVEAHPALAPLIEFYSADPVEMAHEVGMVYADEEDSDADLYEIDFGPREWFEPSAGLAAVQHALDVLRPDPTSVANAIYDPTLTLDAVIGDLHAIERILEEAQQQETRFHFAMDEASAGPRRW
jgi:hypothetical protein